MTIKKVGVLGCGLMGSGIAQVSAVAGYDVVVLEQDRSFWIRALPALRSRSNKFAEKPEKSGITAEQASGARADQGRNQQSDLADCDIIIEAIIENVEEKKKMYARRSMPS